MRNKPAAHKLNQPKKTTIPQYWCFVDVETIPEKQSDDTIIHKFRLGVAIFLRIRKDGKPNKKEVFWFCDGYSFWDKVLDYAKNKQTLHIIAHNVLFDMTVLQFRTVLTDAGFDCLFTFEQALTFISKWRRKETRVMILDNSNWFQGKLAKWGDKLGLEKMTMPKFDDPDKVWFPYCERDVEIIYQLTLWYLDFVEKNDLSSWKYTLASQAFSAFRHRFMNHPVYIPDETRETFLARQSYKGGRTECFYSGKLPENRYYKLDINSMYPYVMDKFRYPTNVEGYLMNPSVESVKKGLTKYGAIAFCSVTTNLNFIPHKHNNKTCYPIGTFNTFLSTPELIYAFNYAKINKVYEIAYYRMRPLFGEYVNFFYNERLRWLKQSDELRGLMCKLLLNSLYGKFGQRGYKDKIIGTAPMGTYETSYYYNEFTEERGIIRQIGENIIKSVKKGESHNAFVAVSSHVSSYARCYLFCLLLRAGRDNVYYVDTDSLFTNHTGYRNLSGIIDISRLGALKVEGISDTLEIVSPKHYNFDGQWKIKGVSRKSPKLPNGKYKQEIWPRLNSVLAREREEYFNYFIEKNLTSKVSSGIISGEGIVTPYQLNEGYV